MSRPPHTPIGLLLTRVAKEASRAFDEALAAAGGSLPVWLILLSLKTRQIANQRELADAIGIQGATLTHHLDAMEADGLVARRGDATNRRIRLVELTKKGEALFLELRAAAVAFDRHLRAGLSADDVEALERLLGRLGENVAGSTSGTSGSDA